MGEMFDETMKSIGRYLRYKALKDQWPGNLGDQGIINAKQANSNVPRKYTKMTGLVPFYDSLWTKIWNDEDVQRLIPWFIFCLIFVIPAVIIAIFFSP